MQYIYKNAPMFLILSLFSFVAGVVYNWSLFMYAFDPNEAHFGIFHIIGGTIFSLSESFKVGVALAVVLNVIYYGMKRVLQSLKIV
ncbi:putative protein OS=Ureibacillus acetophenoni OX=614649 GN=SAMN05877842_102405 PE=4 SV=1 [Ureibacillus acetophenoni]